MIFKTRLFYISFAINHPTKFHTSERSIMHKELKEEYNLWGQFREGNDQAFYLLYDKYADNLYKYGCHFSKDKDLIKDCIHDLFLDLYKYRKRISETESIKFYLFRSLRRIIHKGQVKVIPLVYDEAFELPGDNPVFSHEDYLISMETEIENHKVLYDAIKTLSNRQRESLSLKFEHNHTYPEIAEIMGVAASAIDSYRNSIRTKLGLNNRKVNLQSYLQSLI